MFNGNGGDVVLGVVLLLLLPLSFLAMSGRLIARWILLPSVPRRRAVFILDRDPAQVEAVKAQVAAQAAVAAAEAAAAQEAEAAEAAEESAQKDGGLEGKEGEGDAAEEGGGAAGKRRKAPGPKKPAAAATAAAAPGCGAPAGRVWRWLRAACGAREYVGAWSSIYADSRWVGDC